MFTIKNSNDMTVFQGTREQVEEFTLNLLVSMPVDKLNKICYILPQYSIKHNIRTSTIRILRKLGYKIIHNNSVY